MLLSETSWVTHSVSSDTEYKNAILHSHLANYNHI